MITELDKAVTLTVAGLGAVFLILFLIMLLTLLLKRALLLTPVREALTFAEPSAVKARSRRNDKELAAAAAVAATLTRQVAGGPGHAVSDSPWKGCGRGQLMRSWRRRTWRR